MSEYDAIVIGAGHNGLTAAAVMARGGMRVLCLEKNHFVGGMASTTELVRGYRFELAGSIQFPIPNEIFDDLGLASCPIYETHVRKHPERSLRLPPFHRAAPSECQGSFHRTPRTAARNPLRFQLCTPPAGSRLASRMVP